MKKIWIENLTPSVIGVNNKLSIRFGEDKIKKWQIKKEINMWINDKIKQHTKVTYLWCILDNTLAWYHSGDCHIYRSSVMKLPLTSHQKDGKLNSFKHKIEENYFRSLKEKDDDTFVLLIPPFFHYFVPNYLENWKTAILLIVDK